MIHKTLKENKKPNPYHGQIPRPILLYKAIEKLKLFF